MLISSDNGATFHSSPLYACGSLYSYHAVLFTKDFLGFVVISVL